MGEVSEAQGGAAQVFDSAVDGFGGAVAGAGVIEIGEDIGGSSFHGPAQRLEFCERVGDVVADGVNEFA